MATSVCQNRAVGHPPSTENTSWLLCPVFSHFELLGKGVQKYDRGSLVSLRHETADSRRCTHALASHDSLQHLVSMAVVMYGVSFVQERN